LLTNATPNLKLFSDNDSKLNLNVPWIIHLLNTKIHAPLLLSNFKQC
jgi:hypothetical protein